MFCPECGRDDSHRYKFCPTCGTNLDVVTIALTTGEDGIFTRVNKYLDRSVARYADHYFETDPAAAAATASGEGQIGGSWRLMGKGLLTFFIDLALLPVMFFFLPLRFLLLLLYTPQGLLQKRSEQKRGSLPAVDGADELSKRGLPGWQGGGGSGRRRPVGSVAENTTALLELAEPVKGQNNTSEDISGKLHITTS